ncbi:MAG: outer membrane protein assembly factor BamD [Bacillota bacterium]
MTRSVTALAALLLALALGGCGLFKTDEELHKDWTAEKFYTAAKEELDAGNWEKAAKLYDQLEAKFPFGRYAQQAQIEIAYAYYKQGETAQCVSAVDKFIKLHPNHPNVDYAIYLKGLANFKEDLGPLTTLTKQDLADRDPKAARDSFEAFKDLVTRFPDSRYSADAHERMIYLVEALARHEIHVARYYVARGAYLSAVNRAQDAITRFPNSPTHREALEVMVEAYDRMGMPDMRDDAKRVLAKNYPADPLAQQGRNRASRPWWQFW